VLRNLPFRKTPLGPLDNFLPQHVTMPVLIAANVYARGRAGWSVQVLRGETAWRAERVIFTRKVRGAANVAEVAIELASAVHAGSTPWEDEIPDLDVGQKLKKIMNWD
jgi:hypothetical protein